MGSVNHRMVNVIVPSYNLKKVEEYFQSHFVIGADYTRSEEQTNGFVQFTLHSCGSKVGWPEANEHDQRCSDLVNFCRQFKYDDGSTGVKCVVLEIRENWHGTDSVVIIDESVSEYIPEE